MAHDRALPLLLLAGCATGAGTGADPRSAPRVAVVAPSDADAELVTRTASELRAAGFGVTVARVAPPPGRELAVVRLGGEEAAIALPPNGPHPAETRALRVSPAAAGEGASPAADLALQVAEHVRARVAARAAVPGPDLAPRPASGPAGSVGVALSEGLLPGQVATGGAALVGWRFGGGHRLALLGLLPLSSVTARDGGGSAALRTGAAALEGGLRLFARGPLALGVSLAAGVARTTIDGRAAPPNEAAAPRPVSLLLAAGGELELALGGPFVAALSLRGLGLLPRPGVLIAGARAGAARPVVPLAALSLGARF